MANERRIALGNWLPLSCGLAFFPKMSIGFGVTGVVLLGWSVVHGEIPDSARKFPKLPASSASHDSWYCIARCWYSPSKAGNLLRPIVDKYPEGNMKRTLERGLQAFDDAGWKMVGTSLRQRGVGGDIGSPRVQVCFELPRRFPIPLCVLPTLHPRTQQLTDCQRLLPRSQ